MLDHLLPTSVCSVMLDDVYLLPKLNYHIHCFSLHLTPHHQDFHYIILGRLYHCISLYHFIKSFNKNTTMILEYVLGF